MKREGRKFCFTGDKGRFVIKKLMLELQIVQKSRPASNR
jgi:hypothetical protein